MDDPVLRSKLKASSVGIAGAGGLGSNIAVALARAGVGRIVIVDHDRVERSNLNRQYYFEDQIDIPKVEAIKQNIQRIGYGTDVESIEMKLIKGRMHEPFHDVDIIVEALDSAETKADFIRDIMEKMDGKALVAASGVAGFGRSEKILLEKFGNLYLVQDHGAPSSDEDVLMAPRVALFASYQANVVVELLLEA